MRTQQRIDELDGGEEADLPAVMLDSLGDDPVISLPAMAS